MLVDARQWQCKEWPILCLSYILGKCNRVHENGGSSSSHTERFREEIDSCYSKNVSASSSVKNFRLNKSDEKKERGRK